MIGHFVVFMLRGKMRASSLNACESLLYSFQAIATIVVYFVPRIIQVTEDGTCTQEVNRQTSHRSSIVVSGLDPTDSSILHSPQIGSPSYYHSPMGSSPRRRNTVALPGLPEAKVSEPLSENSMASEKDGVGRRRTLPHVDLSAELDGEQTARDGPEPNGAPSSESPETLSS